MAIVNRNTLEIITDRLLLRLATEQDVPDIVAYLRRNRDFHKPYDPVRPDVYYSEEFWSKAVLVEGNAFLEGRSLRLVLRHREQAGGVLGFMNFTGIVRGAFQACYLGYMLDEQSQGHGYMSEALKAGINYVFTHMNLHRIMANYLTDNTKSAAVLKRLGFEVEGTARKYLRINGIWQDHILTSLVNPDWSDPATNGR